MTRDVNCENKYSTRPDSWKYMRNGININMTFFNFLYRALLHHQNANEDVYYETGKLLLI